MTCFTSIARNTLSLNGDSLGIGTNNNSNNLIESGNDEIFFKRAKRFGDLVMSVESEDKEERSRCFNIYSLQIQFERYPCSSCSSYSAAA